jgi:hypothetical protein
MALHRPAILLRYIAAGELGRACSLGKEVTGELRDWNSPGFSSTFEL